MSQLFHQSGLLYQLYLVWGLGVLAMAYSLRLTLLGMLAAFLIGLGYLTYLWVQPEFGAIGEFSWLRLMVQHMPVLAALMFIPLAYWCRSRWIFRVGAIAVVFSLEANLIRLNLSGFSPWMAAIACALPPALLWPYSDALWNVPPAAESFNRVARTLAITFLSLLFYVLSFNFLWNTSPVQSNTNTSTSTLLWPLLIDILILGGFTLWEWLRVLRQVNVITYLVAGLIGISALVPFWHLSISRAILPTSGGTATLTGENSAIAAVLIFNLLLFLLAVGLVREGLKQSQRRLFWGGMVLLTLQIFTRMWEYNTDLLFKSFFLVLCGFGVIAAGLWFERHIRTTGRSR